MQINWPGKRVRWEKCSKCTKICWKRWLSKIVNWSNGSSQGSKRIKHGVLLKKVNLLSKVVLLSCLFSLDRRKMSVTSKFQTDSRFKKLLANRFRVSKTLGWIITSTMSHAWQRVQARARDYTRTNRVAVKVTRWAQDRAKIKNRQEALLKKMQRKISLDHRRWPRFPNINKVRLILPIIKVWGKAVAGTD